MSAELGHENPALNLESEFSAFYLPFLEKHPRSKQICICGHTLNSHHETQDGVLYCTPGNIFCRCQTIDVYLSVSDARFFKRSTHGWGPKHALGLGLAALAKRGGTANWFRDLACLFEGCPETDITVACFDDSGRVMSKSTSTCRFICKTHLFKLGGRNLSPW